MEEMFFFDVLIIELCSQSRGRVFMSTGWLDIFNWIQLTHEDLYSRESLKGQIACQQFMLEALASVQAATQKWAVKFLLRRSCNLKEAN